MQVEGRRHRFPASREDEREADLEPGRWSASFTLPAWAEPRRDGQAALWLGNAVIPVPSLHGSHGGAPAAVVPELSPEPQPAVPEPLSEPGPAPPAPPAPAAASSEAPRSGPLADLLLKETVAALHAELEQRTADAAHMRGALADSQSELEARSATQAQLEATLGELRSELERLMNAVEDQRRELEEGSGEVERVRAETDRRVAELAVEATALREDLAAANVSREAAISEVAGLRAELGRLGSELAVTRERVGSESGDLGEANRLLADAKALTDQLRVQRGGG